MRKDSPLATKKAISPEDILDKPLIISQQEDKGGPLTPRLEEEMSIIWKKYQVFSKPTQKFISVLQEQLN